MDEQLNMFENSLDKPEIERNRLTDKTRQDKTRQDKTRQDRQGIFRNIYRRKSKIVTMC